MLKSDIGIAFCLNAGDDFVPQHAGLHHVALFSRGHAVLAGAGELESDAGTVRRCRGWSDRPVPGHRLRTSGAGDHHRAHGHREHVVAVGGGGDITHYKELFEKTKAEAVGSASIFHFTQFTPLDIKNEIKKLNVPVRI